MRDEKKLTHAVRRASQVFHFAAQVAVTTSLYNPVQDFEINARGTLNLLEAIRVLDERPPLLFTSTNKVYGGLEDVALNCATNRYEPQDRAFATTASAKRAHSISQPLRLLQRLRRSIRHRLCAHLRPARRCVSHELHLRPAPVRHEDQGWVAHFLIRALEGAPITLYGDGKQVRDILFVEDLVDAFLLAQQHMSTLQGQAFNIGGGAGNTTQPAWSWSNLSAIVRAKAAGCNSTNGVPAISATMFGCAHVRRSNRLDGTHRHSPGYRASCTAWLQHKDDAEHNVASLSTLSRKAVMAR
jgi:CDP-paratose 2-epimerase